MDKIGYGHLRDENKVTKPP